MKNGLLKKYLLLCFGISWPVMIMLALFAEKIGVNGFRAGLVFVMFIPALSALISGADIKAMGWKPNLKKNAVPFLTAWFLPALFTALGALLFFAVFPQSLDLEGKAVAASYGEDILNQLKENGLSFRSYLVISAIQAITVAPLINILPSLGEEIGWRGLMSGPLKEKYGRNRGRILAGVIWGIWHWPIMILAGYEYGTEYIGAPVLGPIVFCLITVCMGILLDYVYSASGSMLAPSLMHGSINACATIPAVMLNPAFSRFTIFGPAPVGLIACIPMVICAFFIWRKTA